MSNVNWLKSVVGDIREDVGLLRQKVTPSRAWSFVMSMGEFLLSGGKLSDVADVVSTPVSLEWLDAAASFVATTANLLCSRIEQSVKTPPSSLEVPGTAVEAMLSQSEELFFDYHRLMVGWSGLQSLAGDYTSDSLSEAGKVIRELSAHLQQDDPSMKEFLAGVWPSVVSFRGNYPEDSEVRLWWYCAETGAAYRAYLWFTQKLASDACVIKKFIS